MKHLYFLVAKATVFCLFMLVGNFANSQHLVAPGYCSAGSLDASEFWITGVQLGTISNYNSYNGTGYEDYTSLSTDLQAGSPSNTMTISNLIYNPSVNNHRLKVFIDYNHDLDFDDLGEEIYSNNAASENSDYFNFSVPFNVVPGPTRMRIRMNASNGYTDSPCGNSDYGEVEDYTVNIVAACSSTASTFTASSCDSLLWNGKTYRATGTYNDTLTNAGGCDSIATLILTIKQISTSLTNITRCASYLWNGSTYNATGTYTYHNINAAGCDSIATLNLRIVPSGKDTQTVVSCTPYTWYGVTYKVSGTYNTTISASGGCKIFATLNLTIPVLTATIATTVPTCVNTATATLTVSNNNGTAPYLYKNGSTGTYQSSNVFTGLKAGIAYRIYWQDANGCTGNSDLITIAQPTPIAVNTSFTSPTCYGQKTATIIANASNGVAGYMYKNGSTGALQSSPTFTGLLAGVNYRIYAQDATGCIGFSDLVNVPQTPAISATFTTTDATCNNVADGSVAVSAAGGNSSYQYKNGTTGVYQSSNVFNGLRSGVQYRIYVQDSKGCTGNTALITVSQPAALTSTTTSTPPSCIGMSDGSATITATSGVAPYQYKYSTAGTLQQSNTFTGLAGGTSFRLYFQDATGCVGVGDQVNIPASNNPCIVVVTRQMQPIISGKAIAPAETEGLTVVLSPNPSNSQFTLKAHSASTQPVTIRVMDANGKSLYQSKGQTEQSIRFGSNFAPGVYVVEVRQGDEVKTVKAVKVR